MRTILGMTLAFGILGSFFASGKGAEASLGDTYCNRCGSYYSDEQSYSHQKIAECVHGCGVYQTRCKPFYQSCTICSGKICESCAGGTTSCHCGRYNTNCGTRSTCYYCGKGLCRGCTLDNCPQKK